MPTIIIDFLVSSKCFLLKHCAVRQLRHNGQKPCHKLCVLKNNFFPYFLVLARKSFLMASEILSELQNNLCE